MNLDKLTVNIRPLKSFQAIDLGLMMARCWFKSLWLLWWQRILPILILIVVFLLGMSWGDGQFSNDIDDIWVISTWLVIWWFKPYADIPMVIFLSQKLFDEQYTRQNAWQQNKALSIKHIFLLLTRYRLGLNRQILMPIFILEQQSHRLMMQRLNVLSLSQKNAITWHTLTFVAMEWLLYIGLTITILQMMPQHFTEGMLFISWLEIFPIWLEILLLIMYIGILSILSPFYVASGFAMYVCKRSLLEGWDIELKFHKLNQRFFTTQQKKLNQLDKQR